MPPKTPRQQLEEAARHILKLGYRVFVSKDQEDSFGYFSDGKHVGYFQQSLSGPGIQIATCNRNPGSTGTGLLIEPHAKPVTLKKIDKDYLAKAFRNYPGYLKEEDQKAMPVNKYSDLDDFLSINKDKLTKITQ